MNVKAKGYILGAIAAASYGMNPLFALPLYKEGMDPDSVLFFRYLFAIPIMALMIKSRRRSFRLQRKEILPLIIMGIMVALSSLTLFLSYNYRLNPTLRLPDHGCPDHELCIQRRDQAAHYLLHLYGFIGYRSFIPRRQRTTY